MLFRIHDVFVQPKYYVRLQWANRCRISSRIWFIVGKKGSLISEMYNNFWNRKRYANPKVPLKFTMQIFCHCCKINNKMAVRSHVANLLTTDTSRSLKPYPVMLQISTYCSYCPCFLKRRSQKKAWQHSHMSIFTLLQRKVSIESNVKFKNIFL